MNTPARHQPLHGFYILFYKEWLRFWKVSVQTLLAPVLTALLFLLVFSYSLRNHVEIFPGVSYTAFLVPGLAMMSVLQNAFANSSSSLMQSKMTGNIIFVLLPPFSYQEFFLAYLLAAIARGLVVGLGVLLATIWFIELRLEHPLWVLLFALFGSGVMGALGIIAGLYSDKVDELAAMKRLPKGFTAAQLAEAETGLAAFYQAWTDATAAAPLRAVYSRALSVPKRCFAADFLRCCGLQKARD